MNWVDVNAELSAFLEDAEAASYPELVRLAAFNRAQDYFATTHTALLKMLAVTAVTASSGTSTLSLPGDLIELAGVKSSGIWLETAFFTPGEAAWNYGYIEMDGGLFFPGGNSIMDLWYYARYPYAQSGSSTALKLPAWSEWAVISLAMAYILIPDMTGQASLRRFQSRREAGTPEMNPSREQANWHLKQYQSIVAAFKPQDRDVLYKPGR